jgi:hypothetical protein
LMENTIKPTTDASNVSQASSTHNSKLSSTCNPSDKHCEKDFYSTLGIN